MPRWATYILGIVASLLVAAMIAGASTLAGHGTAIARIDAEQSGNTHALEQRLDRIEAGQDRLGAKLDRLLERAP